MLLNCNELIKICNAQIEYVKSKNNNSYSSRLCIDAYSTIIKFIEEAKNLSVDDKSRNDFIANKCINALGEIPESNIEIADIWNSAMLNIWNISTTDVDDMSPKQREYINSVIN